MGIEFAKLKAKEISAYTSTQLAESDTAIRKEILDLRMAGYLGDAKNKVKIRSLRKALARVLTARNAIALGSKGSV